MIVGFHLYRAAVDLMVEKKPGYWNIFKYIHWTISISL